MKHLRKIVEGAIVWAPGVSGAVVLSVRGGDFIFDSRQDVSIRYDSHHDGDVGWLYVEERFSFHVGTPEAAVALTRVVRTVWRPLSRCDAAARGILT